MTVPMRMRLLLFLPLLTACDESAMPLPGITGKAGELVVVMDDQWWETPAGDSVFSAMTAHIYGLPQPEPLFDAVHVRTEAFTRIFQTHRNILIVNIGTGLKPGVQVRDDAWATPQLVVEVTAPDTEAFQALFAKHKGQIASLFENKEDERTRASYAKQPQQEAIAQVREALGIRLPVPKGFNVARAEADFIWLRQETKDVNQALLLYTEPYTRQNTFTEDGMIEVMDLFAKKYVPGPDPGTHMKVFREYPPEFSPTALNGVYAARLRGLWNMEGDIMGGPFVCYAFLDEPNSRVVYLHAFVFAPGKNKRSPMRQLEAMIKGASAG